MTKKTFAKLIGVSVKTVTRIETDNASFKAKYLIAISKAFDPDYDYLLCFSDFKAKRNK